MPTIAMPRSVASVITETPVKTDYEAAFDWERDYGALYRACPDAFWLAPDADDLLPKLERAAPEPVEGVAVEDIGPARVSGRIGATVTACLTAGPIFLAIAILADGADRTGIVAGMGMAAMSLFVAPLSMPIGAILATFPVMLGTLILGELGRTRAEWRRPLLWTAVGTALGLVIAAVFANDSAVAATALVLTSAASARIAHSNIRWDGDLPA